MPLGRLRITYTGGLVPARLRPRRRRRPPWSSPSARRSPRPDATAVVTVPWTRNERGALAGLKTTSYAENVVALRPRPRARRPRGAVRQHRGRLCEGTGSNVFVVLDGQLHTPPLTSGCLAGITRELLLEWAADEGLELAEEDVPMAALAGVEGMLLTSSTRDVQPVMELDGRRLADTAAGRAAVELFARRAAENSDP